MCMHSVYAIQFNLCEQYLTCIICINKKTITEHASKQYTLRRALKQVLFSYVGVVIKHGTSSPATLHLMLISGVTLDVKFCRAPVKRGTWLLDTHTNVHVLHVTAQYLFSLKYAYFCNCYVINEINCWKWSTHHTQRTELSLTFMYFIS